jgi:6-phosphogluconate dehydrogenase
MGQNLALNIERNGVYVVGYDRSAVRDDFASDPADGNRSRLPLNYFDSYRSSRLPANLIQAQRDYFGAHIFERTDRPGAFHHEW